MKSETAAEAQLARPGNVPVLPSEADVEQHDLTSRPQLTGSFPCGSVSRNNIELVLRVPRSHQGWRILMAFCAAFSSRTTVSVGVTSGAGQIHGAWLKLWGQNRAVQAL